jgi:DNA modification methylase
VFYTDILKQLHDFSADDVTLYWWYANSLFPENLTAWKNSNWHYSQSVFWLKEHFVFSMGQLFHRIYEPCMVGWKNGNKHHMNGEFATFTEWWKLEKKTFEDHIDAWYAKRDKTNEYIHPTQKPVRLAERALKRSSDEGDIVLDAFAGSGSTMIACDQLKRKTRLIELDPKFCDAIVKRWVQYKEDPTIIKNGNTEIWDIK